MSVRISTPARGQRYGAARRVARGEGAYCCEESFEGRGPKEQRGRRAYEREAGPRAAASSHAVVVDGVGEVTAARMSEQQRRVGRLTGIAVDPDRVPR